MQYKVPQNVDIEDKVIAGLTLRQFMFLMVAGGLILILRYVFVGSVSFLFLPIAIIIAGLGLALAFVKINDRPFEIFLVSAAKTLTKPNKRVWSKDLEVDMPAVKVAPHVEETPAKKSLGELRSGLERLATIVDSGGAHELTPSDERMTNVKPHEADEPNQLSDVLAQTEQQPAELTKIIQQAREYVGKTKKEVTVGEMASTQTKPDDFKYDQIGLSDENKLAEILNKAQVKQKELEKELDQAKIEKFDQGE